MQDLCGYMGKVLRVDLTDGVITEEPLDPAIAGQYVGGSGLGAEILYREVPPGVEWNDPENRIVMASGPLGGTVISGTGTFGLVTKGPMTDLAVTTQANGFWGAFLKFCGYDALIVQGRSPRWVYLHIRDGGVELRDAASIVGKDTWDMEDAIRADVGETKMMSAFGIGPAGENLVRFAVVAGDRGHVASKNGCGAVMGSKRLKAVAVSRGRRKVPVARPDDLREATKLLDHAAKTAKGGLLDQWGTGGLFSGYALSGLLPTRNYTTNLFPEHESMSGEYIRTHFEHRRKACWGCSLRHTRYMKVTEGPYTGYEGEEPDYEAMAAWGSVIGNTDAGAMVMLTNLTDRLGLDVNEAGWTIGWVMECYEKGILDRDDLDGLDVRWDNAAAAAELLHKIARREGVGDLLAEGVMRASRKVGGEAPDLGVYVLKGSTPRGHDHRAAWPELLDTCVSATSTVQAGARLTNPALFGHPPVSDPFSPWEVAGANAKIDGWFVFLDSLGVCRFITVDPQLTMDCLNAITGGDRTVADGITIGRRTVNKLRVFNFRHGLDPSLEAPSARYGSTPRDGPAAGKSVLPHFEWMKRFYFELVGWDPDTGRPLPDTLRSLGLADLVPDLEAVGASRTER